MKNWKFNPKRKSRNVQSFDGFAQSSFASETISIVNNTFLGMDIISHIGDVRKIGFSLEPMSNCYGHYIPKSRNLKPDDNTDFEGLDGLILIDSKDVDQALLPFILVHEGFHALQDGRDYSGLTPMYNNGVIYNSLYRLGDKQDFRRAFKSMERSCDVFAGCVLWEAKKKGQLLNTFSELSISPIYSDMMRMIDDVGEWASDQAGFNKAKVMDYCMFWGNFAGLWSQPYNDYLLSSADRTYDDTEKSIFFKNLPSLPTAQSQIELAHYSLISKTFSERQWNIDVDLSCIESHREKMSLLRASEKLKRITDACEMVKRKYVL